MTDLGKLDGDLFAWLQAAPPDDTAAIAVYLNEPATDDHVARLALLHVVTEPGSLAGHGTVTADQLRLVTSLAFIQFIEPDRPVFTP